MKYVAFPLTILLLCMYRLATADAPLRHFDVYEVPEAGLVVYKPGSPAWTIDLDERKNNDAVLLSTPIKYFPPTSVEIRLNQKHIVDQEELQELAIAVTNSLRRKTGSSLAENRQLPTVNYGSIKAVRDEFNITFNDREYTIRHTIGLMPSGHIITMMATTPYGQIDAIEFMLDKIYSNLKEI